MEKFPFLDVRGEHYDIGKQVGTVFKNLIQKGFTESIGAKKLFNLDNSYPEIIDNTSELCERQFPEYIDELKGMAEGSGIELRKILAVNFMHALSAKSKESQRKLKVDSCSTAVFKFPSGGMVCHNEDLDPVLGKYSYILRYNRGEKQSYLSHTYCGCIPGLSFGFNSKGIAMCCNSLPDPYNDQGIPRILIGKKILEEAKTLDDAIALIRNNSPRSGGVSYNLASLKENSIINVETTSITDAVTAITDRYFRTNHYISKELNNHPLPDKSSVSVERLQAGLKKLYTVNKNEIGIRSILADPGVFVLPEMTNNTFITVCTALFNINDTIELSIQAKDVKKGKYQRFSLNDLI